MKHEFTSEELFALLDWWEANGFNVSGLERRFRIRRYETYSRGGDIVPFAGPPDECAAFLLTEWRKSRGES